MSAKDLLAEHERRRTIRSGRGAYQFHPAGTLRRTYRLLASYFSGTVPARLDQKMREDFCLRFDLKEKEIHWSRMAVDPWAGLHNRLPFPYPGIRKTWHLYGRHVFRRTTRSEVWKALSGRATVLPDAFRRRNTKWPYQKLLQSSRSSMTGLRSNMQYRYPLRYWLRSRTNSRYCRRGREYRWEHILCEEYEEFHPRGPVAAQRRAPRTGNGTQQGNT